MAVVFPSEAIGRRWSGALQARLRGAPLERFLISRGMAPAPPSDNQTAENLVRATTLLIVAGIEHHAQECECRLANALAGLGQIVCLVSRGVAAVISEPAAWRAGALVSAARILGASIGLNAAAVASAALVRGFEISPTSAADMGLMDRVAAAIRGGAAADEALSVDIAAVLARHRNNGEDGQSGD